MFKKSLAAVAVLGAFAGSSIAADVSLYGIVDYGMIYQHQEADFSVHGVIDGEKGTYSHSDSNDTFGLNSGVSSASRFGLKGSEDLGNGYTVSFKLENGFDADDGKLGNDDRLFGREASLTIANDTYGALSFGRMGGVGSSAGTYDTVFAIGDAFDGGDNAIYTGVMTSRYDNMITYQSPKFAGLQAIAQYSFKMDNNEGDSFWNNGEEGHNSADRYAAFALTGEYGALQAVASYEQIMLSSYAPSHHVAEWDDAKIFSLGANYDFGFVKPFAMAQYFESAPLTILGEDNLDGLPIFAEGYSLHLGAQAPVMGGLLTAGIYYSDVDDSLIDLVSAETIAASVKYEYSLSKRTSLYGSIGYGTSEIEGSIYGNKKNHISADLDLDVTQAYVGITHTF